MDEIPKTTKNSVKEVSKVNIATHQQTIDGLFPSELFRETICSTCMHSILVISNSHSQTDIDRKTRDFLLTAY